MAKPGELAQIISASFGLEAATVRQQARVLRDAGLMSKERAGRGAGSLTARDAAHLMIAAAGTTFVSKSADVVAFPGGMVGRAWSDIPQEFGNLLLLQKGHTFADALTALIEDCRDEKLDIESANILVTIRGPIPSASIRIREEEDSDWAADAVGHEMYYGTKPQGVGNLSWVYLPSRHEMDVDLQTSRAFSQRSLGAVANLLNQQRYKSATPTA